MCDQTRNEQSTSPHRRVRPYPSSYQQPSLEEAILFIQQLKIDRMVIHNRGSSGRFHLNVENSEAKEGMQEQLRQIGTPFRQNLYCPLVSSSTDSQIRLKVKDNPLVPPRQTAKLLYSATLEELPTNNDQEIIFEFEMELNPSRFIAHRGTNISELLSMTPSQLLTADREVAERLSHHAYDSKDNYIPTSLYGASANFTQILVLYLNAAFRHFFEALARYGNIDVRIDSHVANSRYHQYTSPEDEYSGGRPYIYYPIQPENRAGRIVGRMDVRMHHLVVNPMEVYADFHCDNALGRMHDEVKPVLHRISPEAIDTHYRGNRELLMQEIRQENCLAVRLPMSRQNMAFKAYAKTPERVRFEITYAGSIHDLTESTPMNPWLRLNGSFLERDDDRSPYTWPPEIIALRGMTPMIQIAMTNLYYRFERLMVAYRGIREQLSADSMDTVAANFLTLHRIIHEQEGLSTEYKIRLVEVLLTSGAFSFRSNIVRTAPYSTLIRSLESADIWVRHPHLGERNRLHHYSLTEPYQRMRERWLQVNGAELPADSEA